MDDKFSITHKDFINFLGEVKKELIAEVKSEVGKEVKIVVNGKMDKMTIKVDKLISDGEERERVQAEHTKKLDEIQEKIEERIDPLIKKEEGKEGAIEYAKKIGVLFIGISAFITSLYIIIQFINHLGNLGN